MSSVTESHARSSSLATRLHQHCSSTTPGGRIHVMDQNLKFSRYVPKRRHVDTASNPQPGPERLSVLGETPRALGIALGSATIATRWFLNLPPQSSPRFRVSFRFVIRGDGVSDKVTARSSHPRHLPIRPISFHE